MREEYMRIRELMSASISCCTPEMKINQVAEMMLKEDCGLIPVVKDLDSKIPVGVITDRDIAVRAVAKNRSPENTYVDEVMTANVISINKNLSIYECFGLMITYKIRRVLVVDDNNHLIGIISQADIANKGADQDLASIVERVSQPV